MDRGVFAHAADEPADPRRAALDFAHEGAALHVGVGADLACKAADVARRAPNCPERLHALDASAGDLPEEARILRGRVDGEIGDAVVASVEFPGEAARLEERGPRRAAEVDVRR